MCEKGEKFGRECVEAVKCSGYAGFCIFGIKACEFSGELRVGPQELQDPGQELGDCWGRCGREKLFDGRDRHQDLAHS